MLGVMRTDLPTDLLIDLFIGTGTAMDRWLMENLDSLDENELEQTSEMLIDVFRRLSEPAPKEES